MPSTSEKAAAYALWVELATRATTQPLHYRSGQEEQVMESIISLFPKVRELLATHADAPEFQRIAINLLNETLRPYTARWHAWMVEDKDHRDEEGNPRRIFGDEFMRREFRQELKALQVQLVAIKDELAALAGVHVPEAGRTARSADLGEPLLMGVQWQVAIESGYGRLATPAQLNAVEAETVVRRRAALGRLRPDDTPQEIPPPTRSRREKPPAAPLPGEWKAYNAAGLALSGGGIRSATFCLGIVQVLVRKGLLTEFDFLSTVSGGGYFGSFLSCALGTREEKDKSATTPASARAKVEDIFHREEGIESGLVRHLRNNSKYLVDGGFLARVRMVGLMASGIAWNIMIMLPLPLLAALLAARFGPALWGSASQADGPVLPLTATTYSAAAFECLALMFGFCWVALPGVQLLSHGQPPKSFVVILRNVWETLAVWLGLTTAVAAAVFLLPLLFHGHEWLRVKLGHIGSLGAYVKNFSELVPASVAGGAGAALAAIITWLGPRSQRLTSIAVKLFIVTGPVLLLFVFLLVGNRLGVARAGGPKWDFDLILMVTAALLAWDWLFVNINTLAPHRYYRGRLCECYLARRMEEKQGRMETIVRALSRERAQGRTEVLKQVKLSDLGADLTAPYHLINMTINAATSVNKNLRGRGGDFFVASRHFVGSPLTGYARTEDMERADPHFDLGTAMAVSGAAASTNMGWQTLPHFRFLMTLFNVRLGYWLGNPRRPFHHRLFEGAGPFYLFREMLGRMDETCRYVNLSDGGHIENLAAYELLRRRVKFIVCVDGGCEPGMECGDLVRLQRYAEIDLGIRMYFDLADLRLGHERLSRAHAILVKVDYEPELAPGTQLGWMLYMKLAMTGIEPAYVKDYQRLHPEFPHESTADQVFEEEQFEAYRALGEAAMSGLFREELIGTNAPGNLNDWFQCLADNLLPDSDPVMAAASAKSAAAMATVTVGRQTLDARQARTVDKMAKLD